MKKTYIILASVLVLIIGLAFSACGEKEGDAVLSCKMASTWKTVQKFQYEKDGENGTRAYAVAVGNDGTVYVAGDGASDTTGSATSKTFIIQKSTDQGETWTTVKKYIHTDGQPGTTGLNYGQLGPAKTISLLAHSNGNIFASFAAHYNTPIFAGNYLQHTVWIVLKSIDNGETWKNVDGFYSPGVSSTIYTAIPFAITEAPNGTIYTTGIYASLTGLDNYIRRSTDSGNTWETINSSFTAANGALGTGLAADSSGNMYESVIYAGGDGFGHFLVRKGTENGTSWEKVYDYRRSSTYSSRASGIFVGSKDNVYALGAGDDANASETPNGEAFWHIHRSTDRGVSWDIVDEYRDESNKEAWAFRMTETTDGFLYAVGFADNENNKRQWVVRRSTDGGSHWGTVDKFQLDANQDTSAFDIKTDLQGNIYVVGYGVDESEKSYWIVRKLLCE